MVNTDQQGATLAVVVNVVHLPERLPEIQGGAVHVTDQLLEFGFVGLARQGDAVQVVVQIKQRVVLPVGPVARIYHPLPEPVEAEKSLLQRMPETTH